MEGERGQGIYRSQEQRRQKEGFQR